MTVVIFVITQINLINWKLFILYEQDKKTRPYGRASLLQHYAQHSFTAYDSIQLPLSRLLLQKPLYLPQYQSQQLSVPLQMQLPYLQ